MLSKNLHSGLDKKILGEQQINSPNINFFLVKIRKGKKQSILTLHASPSSFNLSGNFQTTDYLSYLNFERNQKKCPFTNTKDCYVREVKDDFDLKSFSNSFQISFNELREAEKSLSKCSFELEKPQGSGYFFGKPSNPKMNITAPRDWDGHTTSGTVKTFEEKNIKDDSFQFTLTFIKDDPNNKGWVIHYKPLHPPVSEEIENIFDFLNISKFSECPEFDFSSCYWRFIKFEKRRNSFREDNANRAHSVFENHEQHFSKGIEKLLSAQKIVEEFGMGFLPIESPNDRVKNNMQKSIDKSDTKKQNSGFDFDIALSFAGSERDFAEQIANELKQKGLDVFYDDFFKEQLWGKNLVDFFEEIYSKKSKYCLILVSEKYKNRQWTIHERKSAQMRQLKKKGEEYILPVKVDEVSLPGLPDSVGYISIDEGAEKIADMFAEKLNDTQQS